MRAQIIRNDDIEERIIEHAANRRHVIPVENLHAKKGWWTNSNQLGVRLPFQPPVGREKSPMTVLRLDEAGLPRVWTLALGIEYIGDIVDGGFDCVAEIDFGAGGATQSVEVDWNNGTVISMPFNALDVRAKWVPREGDEDLFPPDNIHVVAQVARGSLSRSIATRSFPVMNLAGVSEQDPTGTFTDIMPLPLFARSVNLVAWTDPATVYSTGVTFEYMANVNGSQVGTITGDFMGPNVRLPVPMFARYFRIGNSSTGPVSLTAQFNLFDV